jgi:hypothetical protein
MYQDPELIAMSDVHDSLKNLDKEQVKRVMDWISSKLNVELEDPAPVVDETPPPPIIQTVQAAQVVPVVQLAHPIIPSVPAMVEPQVESVDTIQVPEMIEVTPPVEESPEEEPEATKVEIDNKESKKLSTKGLGLKRYKHIENLFLAAEIKSVGSRILLAASYLQEKNGFEEMSSYDINSRLKKLGYGVSNITTAINTLLNKKIPLMMQTKKEGTSKQAKRKFKVTEAGLELAKTFLRSTVE